MVALAGEITILLKDKLTETAKELVENLKFEKSLDDLVKKGEIDEVSKSKVLSEIEHTSGINTKIEDFFKRIKNKGKPIREIFISDIVRQLKNTTTQSTEVARALNKDKIRISVLEPSIFSGIGKSIDESVDFTKVSAFEYNKKMYFRSDTEVDKFFNELVHEGTHALDNISGIIDDYDLLLKDTSKIIHEDKNVSKHVEKLNKSELIEFRARIHEREFQIITKQNPDFDSLDELVEFIKKEYN